MKPWQPSDPIGMGEVYLPDSKTRADYGKACRAAVIDSAAKHAINLPTLQRRRDFINSYPANAREALKDRITDLWRKND
jgi:hypothetical protein